MMKVVRGPQVGDNRVECGWDRRLPKLIMLSGLDFVSGLEISKCRKDLKNVARKRRQLK